MCVVLRNPNLNVKENVLSLVLDWKTILFTLVLHLKSWHKRFTCYAKENSNEINFILNHIWTWRHWDHTVFRCYAADLYCYAVSLPYQVEFFVPAQIHYWNILLCSFISSQTSFNTSWSYRCIYVDIQHYAHSMLITTKEMPKSFWGQAGGKCWPLFSLQRGWSSVLLFFILTSYSFIYFKVNNFVNIANFHQLNNYTLIFLFLFCTALAHALYSSSSNSFLSKAAPRSLSNVVPLLGLQVWNLALGCIFVFLAARNTWGV